MNASSKLLVTCLVMFASWPAFGNLLTLDWGLENQWSYREGVRSLESDAATHADKGRKYRAFEFNNKEEVVRVMLNCFERHNTLWQRYKNSLERQTGSFPQQLIKQPPNRFHFEDYKKTEDPFCEQNARKQAPTLFFDFRSSNSDEHVLQSIEVTTIRFSEYKGGGFAQKEAWYDIVLSHQIGKKTYPVVKKLVFTGTGRCELRLWSDNYYPTAGWMAPMGEYLIDIRFVFAVGNKTVSVATGPFKVDV